MLCQALQVLVIDMYLLLLNQDWSVYTVCLPFFTMPGKTNILITLLVTFSNKIDKNGIKGLSDWNETKNSWNKDTINLKKCNLAVTVTSKWCLTNVSYDLLSFYFLITGKLSQCLINLTIFSQSVSAQTGTSEPSIHLVAQNLKKCLNTF